MEDLVHMFVK